MHRPLRCVPALLIALVAAACANEGTISHRTIHRSMIEQAVTQMRGGSTVTLVVIGSPFVVNPTAEDRAAFETQVAANIQDANPGGGAQFSPMTADAARGHRRIVLVFDGPANTNGPDLCDAVLPTGGRANAVGEIRVVAAFCAADNRAYSSLAARHSGAVSAEDPKFRLFLRRIIHGLLPFEDPQSHPDHDRGEYPLAL
ncbi:MAG: hypothetical protein WD711_12915 [Dongiaceae bacterium]